MGPLTASGFEELLRAQQAISIYLALKLLLLSLLGSVTLGYIFFPLNQPDHNDLRRAFPLLGPSITGLFLAIQHSLPLSLGLLGALSIIRFRTSVRSAESLGAIMGLVAISITVATAMIELFLVLLLLLCACGLWQRKQRNRPPDESIQ